MSRIQTRFSIYHFGNIMLSENNTVACRENFFAHALAFSEKPLMPYEIFLLEIDQVESGWDGYLRLGLTQLDPYLLYRYGLPEDIVEDSIHQEISWIYSFIEPHNTKFEMRSAKKATYSILDDCSCLIPASTFKPNNVIGIPPIFPTDRGSRIGIVYIPINDTEAEIHYIINGKPFDPEFTTRIPYKIQPLHVVVGVYGGTKKIRIIQLQGVKPLLSICRDTILSCTNRSDISVLPLPDSVKDYLKSKHLF